MSDQPTQQAPTEAAFRVAHLVRPHLSGSESDYVAPVMHTLATAIDAHAAAAVAEATRELRAALEAEKHQSHVNATSADGWHADAKAWAKSANDADGRLRIALADLATAQRQKQEFMERGAETMALLKDAQEQLAEDVQWRKETAAQLVSLIGTNGEVTRLRAQLAASQAAEKRLRDLLGFAASCIKSGEAWSPTCESMFASALAPSAGPPTRSGNAAPGFIKDAMHPDGTIHGAPSAGATFVGPGAGKCEPHPENFPSVRGEAVGHGYGAAHGFPLEGPSAGGGGETPRRTIADESAAFKVQGPSPLLVKALNVLMDLHCPHCGREIGTEFDL